MNSSMAIADGLLLILAVPVSPKKESIPIVTPLSNAGIGSCYVEGKGIHDGVSSFCRECVSIGAGCGL